ncbi:UPF0481 protein At3g47200-like [Corylus avellana]|uniref:UPF0481 protein At3g47200-like n=1 Tax=Corylus avellana TaxID=13451 RepID=UPI00286B0337|nr:UPF0481 protein At3g47200-like [Corylus avellana]
MAGTEHVISVEELLSRKVNVVRTEAAQTSRSGNDGSRIEVQVIEKDSPRQQWLDELEKAGDEAADQKTGPKIQKVPFLLRDHKDAAKYFEPRVVSLGPIHHGKPKYRKAEKYKLVLANKFVKESGKDKKAESLYAEIEKKIKKLREYFDDDEEVMKNYDDEYLARMLFVDGCAVLQFMYYAVEDKFKDVKIKDDQAAFGQEDLFLLENQLPYQLLEDLMELSEKKGILKNSIERFIERHATFHTKNDMHATKGDKPAPHLLDRLRTKLLGGKSESGGQKGQTAGWYSYRNVRELREVGIKLKPSKTSSLTDVSFDKRYPGHLYLPLIKVDDSTGPNFLNLIAYEMCPDFENDFGVTSYICFLDSLIDHPEDVTELRKEFILHNLLGSDKEVAKLFNDIATDLVPNPQTYSEVKGQIQMMCDSKWRTWIAAVTGKYFNIQDQYFSARWGIITFLVSTLVTAYLSVIQTRYAAQQTWYAAHPPPGPCDDFCKK